MKAIETTATVGPDHKMTVQLPADVAPGEHRIVVVIDENPVGKPRRCLLRFAAHPIGLVSETFTFRREDLYGDGR